MNYKLMENSIQPITKPEEAIAQFVSEQYIDWLMDYLDREVKSWPSLQQIAQAKPKPEKIKKFMVQRYLAAEAFVGGRDSDPGFLGFAVANLSEASDPVAEQALELIEKKRKEEMYGPASSVQSGHNAHHELWTKLLLALGLSEDELKRAEVKDPTRNYISELSDIYSNAEWQATMAAFAAHEKLVPYEYTAVMAMLKENTQLTPADLEVLTLHTKGDAKYVIEANHILDHAAVDQESKDYIFQGIQKQLETRRDFYDALAKYLYE